MSIAGWRRLDARGPDLAADGGGFVLGGARLEQGPADLGDRRRLGDEAGSEIAPAGERAELVDLADVGERGAALVRTDCIQVDHLRGRLQGRLSWRAGVGLPARLPRADPVGRWAASAGCPRRSARTRAWLRASARA